MRKDAKGSTNDLHYHNGSTCHGAPSEAQCIDEAVNRKWLGKVLKRTDTDAQGQTVDCYTLIASSFDHYAKQGVYVAEVYVASRSLS